MRIMFDMKADRAEKTTFERVTISDIHVRPARSTDVTTCKKIADQHRTALGFLTRAIFSEAVTRGQLLVAERNMRQLVGFVRFNHRVRGTETAIYDICVDGQAQRQGIGHALILSVASECRKYGRSSIILRCPEESPANDFYQRIGFQQRGIESGRRRRLVVWRLPVETAVCNS
jgi:ribosomal protein S18 acetylase RimI-like enzyme